MKSKSMLEQKIFDDRKQRGSSRIASTFSESHFPATASSSMRATASQQSHFGNSTSPPPRQTFLSVPTLQTTAYYEMTGTSHSSQTWIRIFDALSHVERELERRENQIQARNSLLDLIRKREKARQQKSIVLQKRVEEALMQ
jgi:hypothetical protein